MSYDENKYTKLLAKERGREVVANMASKPGVLTDWPWRPLGSFKYVVLAPFVGHSVYSYMTKDSSEKDITNLLILPFLLARMLHNQIWISLSRYQTAKGSNRILDKAIEFDQIDREKDWDDQILFNGILFYLANLTLEGAGRLPIWRTDGVIITLLLHTGPVEFLYYWLHRALHHHFLYSRYHSHHHSSIVTEPITSVIHPFGEHIAYFVLFAIPMMTAVFTGTGSHVSFLGYVTYIDFMNNLGHCNFEVIPKRFFTLFPLLKYFMYTPSFHSLHHTKFRTNYSLFMPIYDVLYGTEDENSDQLYETSLERKDESPDMVHLTHLTTPHSIYHLRLGFANLASEPHTSKWYFWLMWPVTLWTMMMTRIYGRTFVVERNVYNDNLKIQTWVIPKYTMQYFMKWQREAINTFIEEAILEAEEKGVKVVSLGLMNQDVNLNNNGELLIRKNPQLKVKIVDGNSLAVGVVLNSIPKETTQIVLRGNLSKIAYALASALCQRGIQVSVMYENEYNQLKLELVPEVGMNLVLAKCSAIKTWLVGDGLTEEEQLRAGKRTIFIPFSQFPPKKIRKDCFYYNTPAMVSPKCLENVDSCENWLPRRAMSAWRVAGIVHGLENWDVNECGKSMFSIEKIWEATLRHGFLPLKMSQEYSKP